jgi:branched-chain amino acid transport system substrate-binding protein
MTASSRARENAERVANAGESPRGPMAIDSQTRDVVNNIYIRKFEKINGQLYNTEFATYDAVADPLKTGTK